jgi:hypothetical protein
MVKNLFFFLFLAIFCLFKTHKQVRIFIRVLFFLFKYFIEKFEKWRIKQNTRNTLVAYGEQVMHN